MTLSVFTATHLPSAQRFPYSHYLEIWRKLLVTLTGEDNRVTWRRDESNFGYGR